MCHISQLVKKVLIIVIVLYSSIRYRHISESRWGETCQCLPQELSGGSEQLLHWQVHVQGLGLGLG
jgi:hypothetical protein